MTHELIALLVGFFLAPLAMMALPKERAKWILGQDQSGLNLVIVGSVLVLIGGLFRWEIPLLWGLGAFLFCLGLMIAIPDRNSDWLLNRRNLGALLAGLGVYIFIVYVIVPTNPALGAFAAELETALGVFWMLFQVALVKFLQGFNWLLVGNVTLTVVLIVIGVAVLTWGRGSTRR